MNYYLILAAILFSYMTVWFGISLFKKRNDLADIAWGLGFVLLSWSGWWLSGNMTQRGLVVAVLVSIWGLRLALHIFLRNRKKTEDSRYAAWREQWGKWFVLRSYFQVYLLQGFLLFLIVLPVLSLQKNSTGSW
jgi:steroid 5-alpha reductase family enzyme